MAPDTFTMRLSQEMRKDLERLAKLDRRRSLADYVKLILEDHIAEARQAGKIK